MDKAKEVLIKVGATKERIVFIALYYRQLFADIIMKIYKIKTSFVIP